MKQQKIDSFFKGIGRQGGKRQREQTPNPIHQNLSCNDIATSKRLRSHKGSPAEQTTQLKNFSINDAPESLNSIKTKPEQNLKGMQKLLIPQDQQHCASYQKHEESKAKTFVSTDMKQLVYKLDPLTSGQTESFEHMRYCVLVEMFEKVEKETKRLIIMDYCVSMFSQVIQNYPQDLLATVYLCVNRVAPEHDGIELGVGDAMLTKVVANVTGKKASDIKKELQQTGDLGNIAAKARSSQRTLTNQSVKQLTVRDVYETFLKISKEAGNKSQDQKLRHIQRLIVTAKGREAAYLVRQLQGRLRIGLAEQTILASLAMAVQKNNSYNVSVDESIRVLKKVYSECPSYNKIVPSLLDGGIEGLEKRCCFEVGIPVKPMLAKPTNTITEVLDKFSKCKFTCEYKYDGERTQIHILEGGKVKIFSRNSENVTGKYLDVAERIPQLLSDGVRNAVFDCEAVAYDLEKDQMQPFQVLSTRARKDVKIKDIKVQVCIFPFDCLYLNDMVLLEEPLTVRREKLYSSMRESKGKLKFAVTKNSSDIEELQKFLEDAIDAGTEGLIVKTMDGTYEPSKRSLNWLKLKKDYMEGVGDSIDVSVIGAWYGKGKRVGVFGSFLLAIYDAEQEYFQSISKIGTGFSEELLKDLSNKLKDDVVECKQSYYDVAEGSKPDVWFGGRYIWEIKAADLSISPLYRAAVGLVDDAKGISVRFPRLVKERDDKGWDQTTSPSQIAEMYNKQIIVQKSLKDNYDGEE
eukprot:TRINITY_DN8911_c0_g1_i3.p1 TRINITY_DN8911_c0_g1~~TRINITY_DN8911_c0_g1_i3.p1  ORF type:complete len:746 (-),score=67.51 TRINITY_DN8911_c0_g1_i3:431-2668(-)